MFRFLFTLSIISFTIAPLSYADKVNQCQWFYSEASDKIQIVNQHVLSSYSKKVRKTLTTTRGDIVAYDFIPGSLKEEPVLILGGLWYKIQFFEMFSKLTTQQDMINDFITWEEKAAAKTIQNLILAGHPIIVASRSTQPESILASLAVGIKPSYTENKSVTLDDHAKDAVELITNLRQERLIGAKSKIQLLTLSFGVTIAARTAALLGKQVIHRHIMAPLSKAGDNFPKETAMQEAMIKNIRSSFALMKLNPLLAGTAEAMMNAAIDNVYQSTSKKYASDLIDNAFKQDKQLVELEKANPGLKEIFKKGLQNDMDAARPDRFSLDDPEFVEQYKNSTIYLAGDEEPARLKSQFAAYGKIREKLGDSAPNLIIMDDAQHAITATAPIQTSHIFSTILNNPKLANTNGSIYYMHSGDPSSSVKALNKKSFDLIQAEVNAESIGVGIPSVLEILFFPNIFVTRKTFHANAILDLSSALQGTKTMPPDFKPNPARPFEKLQYMELADDVKKQIVEEIEKQSSILTNLETIEQKAVTVVASLKDKSK